jgi:hypothetical protein
MRSDEPSNGDPISDALAAAAAVVATAVLTSRGKGSRALPGAVDEVAIDRSLLAVIRETEWRMKEEISERAPEGAAVAFEGLDDVEVAVYLDHPALVSDAMDDGAVLPSEAPKRAGSVPAPAPLERHEEGGGGNAAEAPAAVRARLAEKSAEVEEASYFELLEVARTATEQEIRAAHQRLSAEFSAERFSDPGLADLRDRAEVLLSVLDEAYAILRDPALRESYAAAAGSGDRGE